ncbi:SHC-transforming protein 1-like isoform X2 [Ornithodoros turicata]
MATAAVPSSRQQGLVSRPARGWLHPDWEIMGQGVTYGVRYIGCLEVKTSMKCLDFDTRSLIAKECISRVCEAAGLKTVDKKRKVDRRLQRMLAEQPSMDFAGSNVNLRVTSSSLNLTVMESGEVIASHEMPNISFASGGDAETLDFVAYVAKDSQYCRACFVLECGGGLAQDVITTIGQAFELRFREFMRWTPTSQPPLPGLPDRQDNAVSVTSNGIPALRDDPEYYNDLPGKIPPEAPPPVPPLPDYRLDEEGSGDVPSNTAVKELSNVRRQPTPRQAVPPQPSARKLSRDTNLIDLTGDVLPPAPLKPVHDYVNTDPALIGSVNGIITEAAPTKSTSLDPFDMQPFASSIPPPPPRHLPKVTTTMPPVVPPPRPGSIAPQNAEAPVTAAAEQPSNKTGSASSAVDRQKAALEKEEWFHGTISRQESEARATEDGEFLVRESRGSPGQYVLTGMQGTARRHLLLVDPQGVVRTKDRTFESVSHLINYHRDNGLPIISAESALVLKTAVPRPPR